MRKLIVRVVVHPAFDRFILAVILLNAAVMGMADYTRVGTDPRRADYGSPVAEGPWNPFVMGMDYVFTAIFTLEFVLKVVAMGFSGKRSYLDDPWNDLDFVVVVTGLAALSPKMGGVSCIRTFRVLRPLKTVTSVPGLQKLVVGMLRAIPELGSVLVVLVLSSASLASSACSSSPAGSTLAAGRHLSPSRSTTQTRPRATRRSTRSTTRASSRAASARPPTT